MASANTPTPPEDRRRRADAERSEARILDAAVEALARDPDASMAEIARRADVVRATLAAVTERAMSEVVDVIVGAQPERGAPADALRRVVTEAWRTLGRYHALVAINTRLPDAELHQRHGAVLAALESLIERGQRAGSFRNDVPVSWHLSMLVALIHAASAELRPGRLPAEEVESALVASVLGALGYSR